MLFLVLLMDLKVFHGCFWRTCSRLPIHYSCCSGSQVFSWRLSPEGYKLSHHRSFLWRWLRTRWIPFVSKVKEKMTKGVPVKNARQTAAVCLESSWSGCLLLRAVFPCSSVSGQETDGLTSRVWSWTGDHLFGNVVSLIGSRFPSEINSRVPDQPSNSFPVVRPDQRSTNSL
jgi:hypothetical protein